MERRLAAIFAIDMVGFSRLIESDEEGTLSRQKAHRRELIDPAIAEYKGRIVKSTGDGLLVEFASAVDAILCAAKIQRAIPQMESAVPKDRRIRYRIGLNVGDIVVEDGDIYGDGVNVAARLESLAEPDEIYVSGTVFTQVKKKVELGFMQLGARRLKNISEPVQVYRVLTATDESGKVLSGRYRPPRQFLRRPGIVAGGLVAALVVAMLGVFYLIRDDPAEAARRVRASALETLEETADPRRIAVLYFEPRSPQEELPYLAAGLTEALIDELSQVDALEVTSRNGSALFREAVVAPDSIGKVLRVGTLVDGTVALSEDRIRVNVSFIRASTGESFGRSRVDRPRAELFALQDDLAREVAEVLREDLGDEIDLLEFHAVDPDAVPVEAWELVQRAIASEDQADDLARAGDSEGAMRRLAAADSLLAQAERIAPAWIEPTARRGWIDYARSRVSGFDDLSQTEHWIGEGLGHADIALNLAPEYPDALELRGTLKYWKYLLNLGEPGEGDELVRDAEADLGGAVSVNSQQASAWSSLSHLFANKDRLAEAKLAAVRSYESDPYLRNTDLTLWRLFFISFALAESSEANRWCDEGRRRFPDNPRFTLCRIMVNALPDAEPDVASLWSLLEHYVELSSPDDRPFSELRGQMMVAMALVQAGLPDSARAVVVRSRGDPDVDPTRELAYWESVVRSVLGDLDEAFSQLTIHLAANPGAVEGESWYLEPLREDPRWNLLAAGD